MMRPDAVLFDCDGVLVDSEPTAQRVLQGRLSAAGLELEEADFYRLFLGGTMAGVAETARQMGAEIGPGWVEETYEALFVALESTREIPGAGALLDALAGAGIPFAVCSNGPMRKMAVTLASSGLAARVDGRVLSAHDHPPAKPAPDLYLRGAALCGADPSRCVVVEDSPSGARAARAAGIPCLGLAEGAQAERVAAEGARIVGSLSEVREILLGGGQASPRSSS